jgi:opacity protein-like surface antigen
MLAAREHRERYMQQTTRILLAAAMVSCGTPALAAGKGFYLGTGIGRAAEDPGKSIGMNIGFGLPLAAIAHLQPDDVEVDSGDTAWSIGTGYAFSRYFAAEIEYLDLGTTEYTERYTFDSLLPYDTAQITHRFTSSMTGLSVSALASLPLGEHFALFLRGGALFAQREVRIPLAFGSGDNTFGDTLWLAGAGVDWNFSKHWSVRAEYEGTEEFESTLTAGAAAAEYISVRVRFSF